MEITASHGLSCCILGVNHISFYRCVFKCNTSKSKNLQSTRISIVEHFLLQKYGFLVSNLFNLLNFKTYSPLYRQILTHTTSKPYLHSRSKKIPMMLSLCIHSTHYKLSIYYIPRQCTQDKATSSRSTQTEKDGKEYESIRCCAGNSKQAGCLKHSLVRPSWLNNYDHVAEWLAFSLFFFMLIQMRSLNSRAPKILRAIIGDMKRIQRGCHKLILNI